MDIYVIRHGETEWNAKRRIQGRSDIDLNENGRLLAQATARAMADIPFDIAFSSPLKRAVETARMILKYQAKPALGSAAEQVPGSVSGQNPPGRSVPLILDERIIEMGFGVFEGEVMEETNPRLQGTGFLHFFSAPGKYVPPEGGESFQQVCSRTTAFLKELAARQDLARANVLVSSHGAAIKGLLSSLYPSTIEDFWHGGVHPNCGVSLIRVQDGQMRLLLDGQVYQMV